MMKQQCCVDRQDLQALRSEAAIKQINHSRNTRWQRDVSDRQESMQPAAAQSLYAWMWSCELLLQVAAVRSQLTADACACLYLVSSIF